MQWHDVPDPRHPHLDELAAAYSIHPLHIEDCRQADQRAKVETGGQYLFVSLTLLRLEPGNRLAASGLALFVGGEFLITVHSGQVQLLQRLSSSHDDLRSDAVLYRVLDGVVESYLALGEQLEDDVEKLEDQVVDWPRPAVVERISEIRNTILQFRRVVNATRHIAFQLRHVPSPLIGKDLSPFLRDVHDDLAIILDLIAGERDRLASVVDIYLSNIANRTTEATKTLTLLGTVALPAVVITSFFGMNIEYPAWTKSPFMFTGLLVLTLAVTLFLLWYLKRGDYLPGGTTAQERHPDRARRLPGDKCVGNPHASQTAETHETRT